MANSSPQLVVRQSRRALGTVVEVLLCGADEGYLVSAAEEVFAEVERLEAALSVFRPTSEVSRINAHAAAGAVRTEQWLFDLLQESAALSAETEGAFDFALGPLVSLWRDARRSRCPPDAKAVDDALTRCGAAQVELDPSSVLVRFRRDGVALDLSAIGKGYVVDATAELLRGLGVPAALIQAGWSSVYALGAPPGETGWRVGVSHPLRPDERLAVVALTDQALGVSANSEQAFEHGGRSYGHMLDPCTGWPVEGALCAAVVAPTATAADALSTACFVRGAGLARRVCERRSEAGALLLSGSDSATTFGRAQWLSP